MERTEKEFALFLDELKANLKEEIRIPLPELEQENNFISSLWVGKFLRSKMIFCTYSALRDEIRKVIGGDWWDLAKRVSLGTEVIHLASLIHDDIMDGDESRRGRECLYRRFGVSSAIVWGDWLFARGQAIFGELGLGELGSLAVCILCEGQLLEEKIRSVCDFSWENYQRIIERKTAELFKLGPECLLKLGIDRALPYRDYAVRWGLAFQLVDDLFDWQEDLSAKKLSFPVVLLKEVKGVEGLNQIWGVREPLEVFGQNVVELARGWVGKTLPEEVPDGLEWFGEWIWQKFSNWVGGVYD